jgi:PAS domain S-box-containing protein
MLDQNKNISFWNPAATKMFGYKSSEILNKNLHKILVPERYYKKFEKGYKIFQVSGEGKTVNKTVELSALRKNGKEFPIELSLSALFQDNKWHAVGIVRDITKRKLAEATSQETKEKYRTIIEHIEEGYYEIDLTGNLTYFNESFRKSSGYSQQELMGMNNRDVMDEENTNKFLKAFDRVYKTGKTVYNSWKAKRKDGTELFAVGSISLIRDNDNQPIGYRGIVQDQTERIKAAEKLKKSEERFRTLSDELIKSNSMKELLLDIIAHDLKNPAGMIKGFADFGIESDPTNEILKEIQSGTENLLKVIDNTTILSKVAIGDKIDKEEIDITELIKSISKEFVTQLQYEKMKLDLKLKEKIFIKANPIISEVFRNYISNAIKYASSGKKITIDTFEKDNNVTINIIDHGDTIDKKERENIFKRSIQLGKTKGSGLGLAIVKRIADAHKAEVGIKPNKPTGNIFYIKLPTE